MKKPLLILLHLAFVVFFAHAQTPDTTQKPPLPANGLDPDKVSEGPIVTPAEVKPKFPGGADSLYHYLDGHLAYPLDLITAHVGGWIIVRFTVETDGGISGLQVLRSPDDRITAELIKAFQGLKFIPAQQNGQIVRMMDQVPVRFNWKTPAKFE